MSLVVTATMSRVGIPQKWSPMTCRQMNGPKGVICQVCLSKSRSDAPVSVFINSPLTSLFAICHRRYGSLLCRCCGRLHLCPHARQASVPLRSSGRHLFVSSRATPLQLVHLRCNDLRLLYLCPRRCIGRDMVESFLSGE